MSRLEVGLLDSVAWRQDGQVHVVLHLPTVAPSDEVQVRFRDGDHRVRRVGNGTAAPAGGALVEVAVPGPRLAGGLWRIAVRIDDAETFARVDARLLVRRGQPVALLPGPAPDTRMPPPEPRPTTPAPPVARLLDAVRRRLRRR